MSCALPVLLLAIAQVTAGGAEMCVEVVRGDDSKARKPISRELPRRTSATAVTRNAHR